MKLARNTLIIGLLTLSIIFSIALSNYNSSDNSFLFPSRNINRVIDDNFATNSLVHVAIIGSGQAGLGAALYAARLNRYTVVIEGDKPGGLLTETNIIENWPGQASVDANELVNAMRDQARNFGAQFVTDAVVNIEADRWPFVIHTQKGDVFTALSIIIATGAEPRRLGVPGEDFYFGTGGVSTCAKCDAFFCKDKKVAVVGGGDSAIEEAIQLAQYAQKVIILVRKDRMRAAPPMQERLKNYSNIEIMYNVEIQEINGDGSVMTGLTIKESNKNIFNMSVSRLFLAAGHEPNTELFKSFVATNAQGYVQMEGRTQKTSVQGVFAAGDNEDAQYRQAITASAAGVRAAIDADTFLTEIGLTPQIASMLEQHLFQPKKKRLEAQTIKTLGEFFTTVDTHPLVVAYYYSPGCVTCKKMNIGFDIVSQQLADRAYFVRINVDEAIPLVEEYYVYKVPSVLVFENGSLVAHYKNFMDEQQLRTFVERFTAQN